MSYISAISKEDDVIVWERTKAGREKFIYSAPHYFYYADPDGKHETIYGERATKVTCKTKRDLINTRKQYIENGAELFESDIPPELRVLSKVYYNKPAPKLNISFYDIEVDYDPDLGFSSPTNPYAPINSISIVHYWSKELIVITVPPTPDWTSEKLLDEVNKAVPEVPVPTEYKTSIVVCKDEHELLLNFLAEIEDSDVICGWNSDIFDTPYVAMRIALVLDKQSISLAIKETKDVFSGKVRFAWEEDPNPIVQKSRFLKRLDFGECSPEWRMVYNRERTKVNGITFDLDGRIRTDYMDLYKKYEVADKPSYSLASIEQEVGLNLPKLEYSGSLHDLYRNNYPFFIRYNIRDTEILDGFEKTLGYVELANQMYHISTGVFKHVPGVLKLSEYALVNYCHHVRKKIVHNTKAPEIDRQIAGALVLLPQTGLHKWVGSIDVSSLYPSAIRSINISPETLRGQFVETVKAAEEIANKSFTMLTLVLEDKTEIIKSAEEWHDWLKEKKWAVSGYGTVFDQTEQGIIPAILTEWYNTRKQYQAMANEADARGDKDLANYYDRLQYVYKIKLNSLYGALTNLYFRFYDLRLGESTTGTGRMILKHQCRKVAELLDGSYDVDFPLYDTKKKAVEEGFSPNVALDGPFFNGSFISESVIYGDTDSTYFKTHTENKQDAVKIADFVAAKVNGSYQKFMQDTFLCNPGFDNIIKCGREIVSDNGIFVDKKRYIVHVVDKEGKLTDSMKIMGLDTKKTTLPKHIASTLNGFIEDFLKGSPWEDVALAIVEYKEHLQTTTDVRLIGLPKGIQNVEEYSKNYNRDVLARLPGHVAAAIHYNECLKKYDDKISMPIISGMKIKVFYLEGKHHDKFKSIALPTDLEVMPQWFLDNFTIDYDAHIERLVDNPLQNILTAIGKKSPTRQDILMEELFTF